jgi:hypothetical protein
MFVEWFGLIGALALLIVLTMRGVDLLIAAPVCALLLALSFGCYCSRRLRRRAGEFTAGYMGGSRVHRVVVPRVPARLGVRQGDGGQWRRGQCRAVGRATLWRQARADRNRGACALLTTAAEPVCGVLGVQRSRVPRRGLPRRFIPATIAFDPSPSP